MKRTAMIAIVFAVCMITNVQAFTVYSDTFTSTVTAFDQTYSVLVPASYDTNPGRRFPVLYLLHPAYNSDAYWLNNHAPATQYRIDPMRFIVVMPYDGNGLSWWLNSPKVEWSRYSTYLATELKRRVDSLYRTLPDKGNTGIAGQSMGGFGAIHNRIEHPDVYGSVLMLKPAVNVSMPIDTHWTSNYGLPTLLGDSAADTVNYRHVNPIQNAASLVGPRFPFRIYAGLQDASFLDDSRQFHQKLDSLGVAHEYVEVDENHGGCTIARMDEILKFFDSTFVYGNAAVEPRGRIAPVAGVSNVRHSAIGPVDLCGRRVTGAQMRGTVVQRGRVRIAVR